MPNPLANLIAHLSSGADEAQWGARAAAGEPSERASERVAQNATLNVSRERRSKRGEQSAESVEQQGQEKLRELSSSTKPIAKLTTALHVCGFLW